jgi:L-asparaginase
VARARIAVLGAGGTIAMAGAHPFDWIDYGDTGIIRDVDALVATLDLGLPDVELLPVAVRALPSTGITPSDWSALAAVVDKVLTDDRADGVVITHGTASLEETAFFLHLVHRHAAPVVVVGAQRPPNTASSDAVANLRAAAVVAASGLFAEAGVLVVMNGCVYPARDASKLANHALDAFDAVEFGPLARVEADGTVTVARLLPRRAVAPFVLTAAPLPRVDIALSYAGADGAAIDGFVAAGARGIICAGLPPGRSTPMERAAALRAVAAGVTVVQSSRALKGRVPLQRYNVADDILSGGGLNPHKARILVMLALASDMSLVELQAALLAI